MFIIIALIVGVVLFESDFKYKIYCKTDRYIKVLPEPTTKEYTMDEVLKMAGLDPDKVRVKA